jgi:hypothetical protein
MELDTIRNFDYAGIWKEEVMENLPVPYFSLKEEKNCEKPLVLRQRFETRTGIAQSVQLGR